MRVRAPAILATREKKMEKPVGDRNSASLSGKSSEATPNSNWSMEANYFPSTGRGSVDSWDGICESSSKLNSLDRYSRYQIYYYGTTAEKEAANKEVREILKQQQELILPPYRKFVNRVAESKDVARRVMLEEMAEREKQMKHYNYMTTFRDGNKTMIDYNFRKKKEQRQLEIGQERHRLRLNPINWNHSLW